MREVGARFALGFSERISLEAAHGVRGKLSVAVCAGQTRSVSDCTHRGSTTYWSAPLLLAPSIRFAHEQA